MLSAARIEGQRLMAWRFRNRARRTVRGLYAATPQLVPPRTVAIVLGALTVLGMILLTVFGAR
jgi:hypothetical protein